MKIEAIIIICVVVVFTNFEDVTSLPVKSFLERLSLRKITTQVISPKSSVYSHVLQDFNKVLKAEWSKNAKVIKSAPIFKKGTVYKFLAEKVENNIKQTCFVRIDTGVTEGLKKLLIKCW